MATDPDPASRSNTHPPSPELMQQMFERFMEHVTDKEPGVRVQCILALKTFQVRAGPRVLCDLRRH